MKNEPDQNSLQPAQESLHRYSRLILYHFFNRCICLHLQKSIFIFLDNFTRKSRSTPQLIRDVTIYLLRYANQHKLVRKKVITVTIFPINTFRKWS